MKSLAFVFPISLLAFVQTSAQAPSQPPGIPEPGIVLYGLILAADGIQTVPAQSVTLRVAKEGGGPIVTEGEVFAGSDGRWRYLAHIPFETVLPGLVDTPAQNFNQDQTTDDTYSLFFPNTPNNTVGYEGQSSNVSAVDGDVSASTFAFGAKEVRGRMVRMDIQTIFDIVGRLGYDQWAAGIFGGTGGEGARTADPDGDGLNNEFEWIAGLDPKNEDPDSPMNRLVIEIHSLSGQGGEKRITFRPKVPGRSYTVQKRDSVAGGTWIALPTSAAQEDVPLPGIPDVNESRVVDPSATASEGFYRLRIQLQQ